MDIEKSRQRLAELNTEANSLRAKVADENRDLTRQEAEDLDKLLSDFDSLRADIDRLEKLGEQTELLHVGRGRKTLPEQPVQLKIDHNDEPSRQPAEVKVANRYLSPIGKGNCGYKTFGHFASDVRQASLRGR